MRVCVCRDVDWDRWREDNRVRRRGHKKGRIEKASRQSYYKGGEAMLRVYAAALKLLFLQLVATPSGKSWSPVERR